MHFDSFASPDMKVTIVSGPLVTKGGVFRSTCELVESARNKGLDWSAIIFTRGDLGPEVVPPGVQVRAIRPHGPRGLVEVRRILASNAAVQNADAVVSMIPQTDVILSLLKRRQKQIRVAFVRGAAWPRRGEASEAKRLIWRVVERRALSRMDEVWSTTPILREDIEWPSAVIVPAGIAVPDCHYVSHTQSEICNVVWAARMSVDKNPQLFLDILRDLPLTGTMYGDGELRQRLEASAPKNVRFGGWVGPETLWHDAGVYLGTSLREAFGRSAVEAAFYGIPMVLSNAFGAAPLLFTDEALARRFVLDPTDSAAWARATRELATDEKLRQEVGNHVRVNAQKLTIGGSVDAICAQLDVIRVVQR